jgi:alpha-glucosidase
VNRTQKIQGKLGALLLGGFLFLVASVQAPAADVAGSAGAHSPWWTHATIYEIYPRSFQDSNGDGIGDLRGVMQRLDYLKELGVDAIWLTPFYPSPNADFGYDVADYTNVAPEYGTMADWNALVREARKRGIRILVDLVVNHSSDQHPWFKESRSSKDNPKRDWYIWNKGKPGKEPPTNWESIFGGPSWTFDEKTQEWYYHIFLSQQPDLNWASPGLRKAMFDVVRFWLDRGASGFRLDATPYLFEDQAYPQDPDPKSGAPVWLKPYNSGLAAGHGVLREMRRIADSYPGERMLLGESSTATIEELRAVYGEKADEINLPINFLVGNLHKLDAADFKRQYEDAQTKLDGLPPVYHFSSHDHSRQWSSFGDGSHNDQIAKLTATLTLASRGTALLYYGEELGMRDMPADVLKAFPLGPKRPVADDRDKSRTPMQWSSGPGAGFSPAASWLPVDSTASVRNVETEKQDADSIYNWYAKLIKLRKTNPALRDGAYVPLDSGNAQVFAFGRLDDRGQAVLVALNTSGAEQRVTISGWPNGVAERGTPLAASPASGVREFGQFTLPAFGVVIAALDRKH